MCNDISMSEIVQFSKAQLLKIFASQKNSIATLSGYCKRLALAEWSLWIAPCVVQSFGNCPTSTEMSVLCIPLKNIVKPNCPVMHGIAMDIIRDIHVCFILGTFGVVEDPSIYCLISCHIFLCSFGLLSMLHSFCHQAGCMYVPFISFQTGRHLSVSFPISQLSSLSHVPHLSADGLGHQQQDCNCTSLRAYTISCVAQIVISVVQDCFIPFPFQVGVNPAYLLVLLVLDHTLNILVHQGLLLCQCTMLPLTQLCARSAQSFKALITFPDVLTHNCYETWFQKDCLVVTAVYVVLCDIECCGYNPCAILCSNPLWMPVWLPVAKLLLAIGTVNCSF